MSELPPEPVSARDKVRVIAVPGGDIAALYDAVYDERGRPRDNAAILLAPGVFRLDPLRPFGGRLVLGRNTFLRSVLSMAVDDTGVPRVDERGEPTVLEEGARIDGGNLAPDPAAYIGEGVIVVGDGGRVQRLRVDCGPEECPRPGIDIIARGTVRDTCVSGHRIGLRVRDAGEKARGIVTGCLVTRNGTGMIVLSLDPDLGHPTGGDSRVEARISRSASVNNLTANLLLIGGIGSDRNGMYVESSHNLFGGCASGANVRVVGGQNVMSPGSHHNRVKLRSTGDRSVGAAVGLQVEGGALQPESLSGGFALLQRQSSYNTVTAVLADTTFESNDVDIAAYGAISRTHEPGGGHNEVRVEVVQVVAPGLTTQAFDCFPQQNFATCSNKVDVGPASAPS